MAELTSGIKMMGLQHFCGTAILASPSIPVQDFDFEMLGTFPDPVLIEVVSGEFAAYIVGWLALG
jgi:hypothetical protein